MTRYRVARDEVDVARARLHELERTSAPYERLVRALDTTLLAGTLRRAGGAAWRGYERLLACERGAP